jgi:hypothetical protein
VEGFVSRSYAAESVSLRLRGTMVIGLGYLQWLKRGANSQTKRSVKRE